MLFVTQIKYLLLNLPNIKYERNTIIIINNESKNIVFV